MKSSHILLVTPFWHDDGDAILCVFAPGAKEEQKLCTHKSLLSLHSPVFRATLEVKTESTSHSPFRSR